jgi:hypothetical protein
LNSTIVGLVAFFSTFGAALAALYIRERLPAHHVEGESKDLVKLVMGLIATITALVLGLLISSAHSSYDAQEAELQQLSVHLFQIDRVLAHYGPAANGLRVELKQMAIADMARIWPEDGNKVKYAPMSVQMEAERIFDGISSLPVNNDLERWGQNRALQLLSSVGETRRLLTAQAQGSLSWQFLLVLISWLTLLFFGFGLCARLNPTVVVALFVGSLSIAGAIFLILEMNHPYSGWMQVSSEPLRAAIAEMGL